MMTLAQYIEETGIPAAVLGRRCGVECRATFWNYVQGKRRPPEEVIERIYDATGGKVKPSTFLWPKVRKRLAQQRAAR